MGYLQLLPSVLTADLHFVGHWLGMLTGFGTSDSTLLNLVLVIIGMAAIAKGGDLFTDSEVAIAKATRIPPAIIGATIVSMATKVF